jgi:hypothetical protein
MGAATISEQKSRVGGYRPGAGRPKGSKNKRKVKSAVSQAVVSGALALASTGAAVKGDAPTEAPEGISPRDLLLATMRMAWEAAHAKSRDAESFERLAAESDDPATAEGLREKATTLRMEAGRHVALAQQAAKDVAPYEHPRLQTVDANVTGGLVVEIKQYTIPKEKRA